MRPTELNEQIFNRQQTIKLLTYKYAIILGVGGIGSWVAFDLALTGKVDRLFLVDPDNVDGSNLNRTPFRFCDIGQPKVVALKYLILERRAVDVLIYQQKTSASLYKEISKIVMPYASLDPVTLNDVGVIIDCRDDVYEDFYGLPFKYYKIGYDGLSITIDGNPRNTAVWGRANSYRFTPSFICPSQLAANLVVTDILADKLTDEEKLEMANGEKDKTTNNESFDFKGRLNKAVTFDVTDLMEIIYRETKAGEGQ